MRVRLTVELEIEPVDDDIHVGEEEMRLSAVEAVANSLEYGYHEGFHHALADETAIRIINVDLS